MAVASRLGPGRFSFAAVTLALLLSAPWAQAKDWPTDFGVAPPDATARPRGHGAATPTALPDIFGPGSVLNVGNVFMKITNTGILGNPFTTSSDPAMQWPGPSGIEYLTSAVVVVGGVNPVATDPAAIRRVSSGTEWRPPSLEPVDIIYRGFEGAPGSQRLTNDDGDTDPQTGNPRIDEDFLDGHDNDGDGRIDEDYDGVGQQMFSCVMRDDTPAAINTVFNEKHVPLGLELRQRAWAYSIGGFEDFNPVEFTVINRSGHTLDSMYFGMRLDMDCGPRVSSTFFADDLDAAFYPQGTFAAPVAPVDPRLQLTTNPSTGKVDSLCPRIPIRIHGVSILDDDGDDGKTPGVASMILLGHTIDPLGITAPQRVQFRAVRSYIGGTPFQTGGNPTVDTDRYALLSSHDNVDPETGMVTLGQGEQTGDYIQYVSVGPFNQVADGGSFTVTFAFIVQKGDNRTIREFPADMERYQAGLMQGVQLFQKYPVLATAYAAQVAYEGVYELPKTGFENDVPNCHGCETSLQLPRGTPPTPVPQPGCDGDETTTKTVTDFAKTWFNFDCDFCTGVWDETSGQGYYLRRWNAESPPPSPGTNVAANFNYTANPNRAPSVTPAGDHAVTVAWNNSSETTPDPKTHWFDFRSYRVWKTAGWTRPAGSSGPSDADWSMLAEFRLFDHADDNRVLRPDPSNPGQFVLACPTVWIPQKRDSMQICLQRGDLWNPQSGEVIRPDPSVDCVRVDGDCAKETGLKLGSNTLVEERTKYPVGRYKFVDHEALNGFTYFYSVTAGDSANGLETFSRVSGVEAEGVTPQASTRSVGGVWVVPNPYRGYSNIAQRSSAWDLTPNASDPTGTHIDFMGLPNTQWKIRIYTIAGDLVAELHSTDAVNAEVRQPVTGSDGITRSGANLQQDTANDGQARWNLISRNGQDVVSGIYVFVVESDQGQQRGRFVVIR